MMSGMVRCGAPKAADGERDDRALVSERRVRPMRYLEILLAGLIYLASFVVGSALPQIRTLGPMEPEPGLLGSPLIPPMVSPVASIPENPISTTVSPPVSSSSPRFMN